MHHVFCIQNNLKRPPALYNIHACMFALSTPAVCMDFFRITPSIWSTETQIPPTARTSGGFRHPLVWVANDPKMQLGSVCLLKGVQRGLHKCDKEIGFLTVGREYYYRSCRIIDIRYCGHYYYTIHCCRALCQI